MKIINEYDRIYFSRIIAQDLYECVKEKPDALLCLAGGDSPLLVYKYFCDLVIETNLDVSQLNFVSLDEWINVEKSNPGSCFSYLSNNIFKKIKITDEQIYFFEKNDTAYEKQVIEVNQLINEKGGIDYCILGVGVNGHVGFNEPAKFLEKSSHIVNLDLKTVNRSKNYFGDENFYTKGISLGIGQLMQSKQLRIVLTGQDKRDVFKYLLGDKISTDCPVSLAHLHNNCILYSDVQL